MTGVDPNVLGYRLDPLSLDEAANWILERIQRGNGQNLVVTLNPEILVRAITDPALNQAIKGADLTVADGVGLVWAARWSGYSLPGRVPGVDLVSKVLEMGGPALRVFFLGGREGVAAAAAKAAANLYGTTVTGTHHGYFAEPSAVSNIVKAVRISSTQLLLAGLGESQERFLNDNRSDLGANVMIGVGGTLDILAGRAERAPNWTRHLGVEWAWRMGLNPRRWHRIPRLVRFVLQVVWGRHS
jgi:N-acetylglucosaminyldiphosphoundecaprenol N-acetyl-beta-D-mannosaminyltransferase